MIPRFTRTLIAVVLTLAAVSVPLLAWYVVGSREAEREARFISEAPRTAASRTAARAADRIGVRLETLKEVESRRPFLHYLSHYHDPDSDCECASITPSPLAHGPADPMIWAYFQVDEGGRLTLPNFDEELHRTEGAEWMSDPAAIFRKLVGVVGVVAKGEPQPPSRAEILRFLGVDEKYLQHEPHRTEWVELRSWTYNMELCGIQCDAETAREAAEAFLAERGDESFQGDVPIEIGELRWRTAEVEGEPSLLAVRHVLTPGGTFYQGFVANSGRVRDILASEAYPTHWAPGPPPSSHAALVPVSGVAWHVEVDAGGALAAAARSGDSIRRRFRRDFMLGSVAAVLAGFGLVSLVWQTDRLARQRSRFAASAAHELRTPLAGMRMYSEMLSEQLGDPGKSRHYAGQIAREADRLGRVVANVMGYSRLERGSFRLQPQPGDLAATISEAVEVLRPTVESAGATLTFSRAESLPPVLFDGDAVRQIVQNLVDNAEKFSRGSEDRAIAVRLEPAPGGVSLSVSDSGPGVSPEARKKIFQPFTRDTAADAPAGLGLGLTLVRALARAHGGTIECTDSGRGGARFSVFLPA